MELARIAFVDGSTFATITARGKVKFTPTDELTHDQRAVIAGVKNGKFGTEIKTNDKVRALELLGKHLGMFKDRVEVSGTLKAEQSKLADLIKQMSEDE